jgi:hypothetical protein
MHITSLVCLKYTGLNFQTIYRQALAQLTTNTALEYPVHCEEVVNVCVPKILFVAT